jgi:hypothetical protein
VARAPSERLQEGINRLIFLQTRLKLKLCPVIGNSRDKRNLWKKSRKKKTTDGSGVSDPSGDNIAHQRMNQATTLTSQVITGIL